MQLAEEEQQEQEHWVQQEVEEPHQPWQQQEEEHLVLAAEVEHETLEAHWQDSKLALEKLTQEVRMEQQEDQFLVLQQIVPLSSQSLLQ